ncbi:hypothetical protein LLEC1_01253 [Akanthomyces lecanii]|uniref:Uncharacterized protein n=1 Tax=Cordyceps confragosa TaxID=2714763 RepID=A0A179IJK7_CORDF|nr:hypothetical protein LLEC1_01253 [Akanthomyces lecanii]
MHQYSLTMLTPVLLYSHGVMAAEFAQLAIEWCLNHPDAQGGSRVTKPDTVFSTFRYAQCASKVVCKPSGQASGIGPDSVACQAYGECDCSRFKNKDSDEYFQCISNSKCAACCSPDITPVPSTSSLYELETLAPGTYTLTYDGTTKTAVVPPPTATVTDCTTVTAVSTFITVTVTEDPTAGKTPTQTTTYETTTSIDATQTTEDTTTTTTLTQSSTYKATTLTTATYTTATTIGSTSPTSTAPPLCPSYCDCEPKYEACLQQPECAGCGIPFPPLPDPTPEPTTTDCQNSTTKPTPQPTPSCAAECDCSGIDDTMSDAYVSPQQF